MKTMKLVGFSSKDIGVDLGTANIIITIKKKRNFDMSEFIDMEKERYELAELLDLLMAWTADSENNRKFKRLLE